MSLCSLPLAAAPVAAEQSTATAISGGALAPFTGTGSQGTVTFRGERFWATETRTRWRARESDSQSMLGTTDKTPVERVRYECDFIDILNGADITSATFWVTGSLIPLSNELVSNGSQVHLVRVLVDGGSIGDESKLSFYVQCSDGAVRFRTLKIRVREL
jgi:hypothetical protein